MSKVAVAILTYNRVGYLKECIQSVLNQTFQDVSIYIFDNASTEPIKEAVESFGDSRITFIGAEQNVGAEGNINRAIEYVCKEQYVVMFHDDDTMHPKMLEAQVRFLDAHTEAQFVLTDLQRGSDGGMQNFAPIDVSAVQSVVFRNGYEFIRAQMNWLRYGFPSVMYRKSAFGETRIRPEFFHFFDMIFVAEIAQKGECGILQAPLMIHRVHEGQYTESRKKDYREGIKKLLVFLRDNVERQEKPEDMMLFRKHAVNSLLRACSHINYGLVACIRFLHECKQEQLFSWTDMRYIDTRGGVSLLSVIFKSRKIIDIARWIRNLLI